MLWNLTERTFLKLCLCSRNNIPPEIDTSLILLKMWPFSAVSRRGCLVIWLPVVHSVLFLLTSCVILPTVDILLSFVCLFVCQNAVLVLTIIAICLELF